MFPNISGEEFLILIFVALILIGPERLPQYAEQLGRLVKSLKEMMSGAKTTLKEELGDDYNELAKFNPRQYDPRRIVREALLDDVVPASRPVTRAAAVPPVAAAATGSETSEAVGDDGAVSTPFDDEAT